MKTSGRLGLVLAVALAVAPDGAAAAGKFDGSTPLLCVPVTVSECVPDGKCERVTAERVNLPQFLKVDVQGRKIRSEETGRESPIRNIEHLDGNMILQGGQAGRGWTMTISEETGKMSSAIAADGEGFIVFGACTVQP